MTMTRSVGLCLFAFLVRQTQASPVEEKVRGLSESSFEARQAAAEWLAAEGARLEREGAKKDLSVLMGALRRAAAEADDAEARAAAERVLFPFLGGSCRWMVPSGPVTEAVLLPEGMLLADCTNRKMAAHFLLSGGDGGEGQDRIALYRPETGSPVWETSLEGTRLMAGSLEVRAEEIVLAGIRVEGEEGEQRGWVGGLDRRTGRPAWQWETSPFSAPLGGVTGVRLDGSRVIFFSKTAGATVAVAGQVDCFDRKDPEKPAWSLGLTGGPPEDFRIASMPGGERIALFWTAVEAGACRLSDGRLLWRRPLKELGFDVRNVIGYGFNLKSALTPAGFVLGGALPPDPVAGTTTHIARCLSVETGDLLWKNGNLPGAVMKAECLDGEVWAGGSASGELEGPWWMGLYDAATGKPRWEVKNVTLLQDQYPAPLLTPGGILVGIQSLSGLRPGAVTLAGQVPVSFYDASTGKLLWRKSFNEVPPGLSRIAWTPAGVVAAHAKGISLYRLADADAE